MTGAFRFDINLLITRKKSEARNNNDKTILKKNCVIFVEQFFLCHNQPTQQAKKIKSYVQCNGLDLCKKVQCNSIIQ